MAAPLIFQGRRATFMRIEALNQISHPSGVVVKCPTPARCGLSNSSLPGLERRSRVKCPGGGEAGGKGGGMCEFRIDRYITLLQ